MAYAIASLFEKTCSTFRILLQTWSSCWCCSWNKCCVYAVLSSIFILLELSCYAIFKRKVKQLVERSTSYQSTMDSQYPDVVSRIVVDGQSREDLHAFFSYSFFSKAPLDTIPRSTLLEWLKTHVGGDTAARDILLSKIEKKLGFTFPDDTDGEAAASAENCGNKLNHACGSPAGVPGWVYGSAPLVPIYRPIVVQVFLYLIHALVRHMAVFGLGFVEYKAISPYLNRSVRFLVWDPSRGRALDSVPRTRQSTSGPVPLLYLHGFGAGLVPYFPTILTLWMREYWKVKACFSSSSSASSSPKREDRPRTLIFVEFLWFGLMPNGGAFDPKRLKERCYSCFTAVTRVADALLRLLVRRCIRLVEAIHIWIYQKIPCFIANVSRTILNICLSLGSIVEMLSAFDTSSVSANPPTVRPNHNANQRNAITKRHSASSRPPSLQLPRSAFPPAAPATSSSSTCSQTARQQTATPRDFFTPRSVCGASPKDFFSCRDTSNAAKIGASPTSWLALWSRLYAWADTKPTETPAPRHAELFDHVYLPTMPEVVDEIASFLFTYHSASQLGITSKVVHQEPLRTCRWKETAVWRVSLCKRTYGPANSVCDEPNLSASSFSSAFTSTPSHASSTFQTSENARIFELRPSRQHSGSIARVSFSSSLVDNDVPSSPTSCRAWDDHPTLPSTGIVDVIGHSYGTAICSSLHRMYPNVIRQCVLMDPICFFPQITKKVQNFLSVVQLFTFETAGSARACSTLAGATLRSLLQ